MKLNVNGQNDSVNLKGVITVISDGMIYLVPVKRDQKYYGSNPLLDSSKISKGKFEFRRNRINKDIQAYYFLVKSKAVSGRTGMVMITPQAQNILIEKIDDYLAPIIFNSKRQKEIKNNYEPYFAQIIKEAKELSDAEDQIVELGNGKPSDEAIESLTNRRTSVVEKADSLLFNYAKKNANSEVALWKLIEKFENFGYKGKYVDIFNLLSSRLKNSLGGVALYKDLTLAGALAIGVPFPPFTSQDIFLNNAILDSQKFGSKYTLIDFWFSACKPCIRQFPALSQLYNSHQSEGFEIIGISIDRQVDIGKWKSTILQNGIIWPQFIDLDGKISEPLGVNSFPTNFLLNDKGVIIFKNISIKDLETYLKNKK